MSTSSSWCLRGKFFAGYEVGRSIHGSSLLRLRSSMGLPIGKPIVLDNPIHVNDELIWDGGRHCIDRITDTHSEKLPGNDELLWDSGTTFSEPCIERITDTFGKVCILTAAASMNALYVTARTKPDPPQALLSSLTTASDNKSIP